MKRMEKFCDINIDVIGVNGVCFYIEDDVFFKYRDNFYKVDDILSETSIMCNVMRYFREEVGFEVFKMLTLEEKDYTSLVSTNFDSLPGWHGDYVVKQAVVTDEDEIIFDVGAILHWSRSKDDGRIILTKIADNIDDFKRVYDR